MNTMPVLNSQVLRAAGVALISLIALLVHMIWGNISEATVTSNGSKILEAVLALISSGGVAWAMLARAFLPNPPLTPSAADKHDAILAAQGIVPGNTPVSDKSAATSAALVAFFALLVPFAIASTFAVAVVSISGCQSEPVAAAQTLDQKAAALLGDYNIYAAAAVTIGSNTGVPAAARKALLDAVIASKPIADSMDSALRLYRTAESALSAGTTTADKVAIVAANLTDWLNQLVPLVNSLESAAQAAETP